MFFFFIFSVRTVSQELTKLSRGAKISLDHRGWERSTLLVPVHLDYKLAQMLCVPCSAEWNREQWHTVDRHAVSNRAFKKRKKRHLLYVVLRLQGSQKQWRIYMQSLLSAHDYLSAGRNGQNHSFWTVLFDRWYWIMTFLLFWNAAISYSVSPCYFFVSYFSRRSFF